MLQSSMARAVLIAVAVVAVLAVLRSRPWQRSGDSQPAAGTAPTAVIPAEARPKLTVGFLPVT
jgi:hypothetical protein